MANMVEKRSIRAEGTKEGRRYLSPEREGRKEASKKEGGNDSTDDGIANWWLLRDGGRVVEVRSCEM